MTKKKIIRTEEELKKLKLKAGQLFIVNFLQGKTITKSYCFIYGVVERPGLSSVDSNFCLNLQQDISRSMSGFKELMNWTHDTVHVVRDWLSVSEFPIILYEPTEGKKVNEKQYSKRTRSRSIIYLQSF